MRRCIVCLLLCIGLYGGSNCNNPADPKADQRAIDSVLFKGLISKIPHDTLPHYFSSSWRPSYELRFEDTIYFPLFKLAKLIPILEKRELNEFRLREDSLLWVYPFNPKKKGGGYYMKNIYSNNHFTILELTMEEKRYLLFYRKDGVLINAIGFGKFLEWTDINQEIFSNRYLALKENLELEITDEIWGNVESSKIVSTYQINENGEMARQSYKQQLSDNIQILDSLVNPRVRLYKEGEGYYLSIFQNNRWQPWFLFSEATGFEGASIKTKNINSTGNEEIVIDWAFSTFHSYGPGNGGWSSHFKSLDILDIDTRTSLFSAMYYEVSQSSESETDSTGNLKETTSASYEYDVKMNSDNSITISNLRSASEDLPLTPPPNFKEGTYVLSKGKYVLR